MHTKLTRPSFVQLLPILFFLLAAIPAAAIGVLLTHSAWERELQTVQEQHLQIARNLVAALTRYAADVEAAFQMTVANVAAQQPVRRVSTLLSGLHFKHVCIVNAQGQVEHFVAPDADLKIESVPEPLLEKLRAGETWEVLPDHAGEPTLFLLQPLDGERYALGALRTDVFCRVAKRHCVWQERPRSDCGPAWSGHRPSESAMADHHAGPLCIRASAPHDGRRNRCDAFLLSRPAGGGHHGF